MQSQSPAPPEEGLVEKKELTALIEISRLLVSTAGKDELLSHILSAAAELMNVEACSIILHDKEQDDMTFYMSKGPGSEEITQIRLARGEGIAGWVFLNGQSLIVNDTAKDERFSRKVDDSVQFSSKSLMCVPVLVGNTMIGVMEAVNKRQGGCFTEADQKLFESISNHAGEAIEKARLIEENLKSMRLATIGQTLSSLSHCIKNILNGLSGGSFIVNKALSLNNLEMVRDGWDIVDKCIARITDLSMNLLAYSKDRSPHYEMVNPNKIIRELSHILSKKMEEHSISYRTFLGEELPEIPMDSFGIFRCLLNILTNAIEACPPDHGEIIIKSSLSPEGRCIIEIADNGPGIDQDTIDKIFSVFYSTKGGKGTGLGLAVTKKILDEHGGKIWLSSIPREGTSFYVELPAESP
jgi:signal transduction histidine kinase